MERKRVDRDRGRRRLDLASGRGEHEIMRVEPSFVPRVTKGEAERRKDRTDQVMGSVAVCSA